MEQYRFVDVDGARLRTLNIGEGANYVLLINGHTRSLTDFRMLMRHLASKNFNCIAFDNRGAGETTTTRAYNLSDMVSDAKTILNQYNVNLAHVLGISMGGIIAQHLCAAEQNSTKSLTLISTTCENRFLTLSDGWGTTLEEVRKNLSKYFSPNFMVNNRLLADAMSKQIFESISSGSFTERSQDQRNAIADYDTISCLKKIRQPVLVIHGAEDQIIDVKVVAAFSAHLTNAKSIVYPDAGHLLLAEKPRNLQSDICAFLEANS